MLKTFHHGNNNFLSELLKYEELCSTIVSSGKFKGKSLSTAIAERITSLIAAPSKKSEAIFFTLQYSSLGGLIYQLSEHEGIKKIKRDHHISFSSEGNNGSGWLEIYIDK